MAIYLADVRDDLLLELPAEAAELHLKPGDKVQVQLEPETIDGKPTPNEGMLAALREIEIRQRGTLKTDGSDTDRLLREARSGAMWGVEPIE